MTDEVDCGEYSRARIVFDTEATMSVPAYLLVPHSRAAPSPARRCSRSTATVRARRWSAASTRAGRETTTRTCSRRRATSCSPPTCAASASAADWMPDDKYHCDWDLVCATMAGVVPLERNLWDLRRALDVLGAHPLVDPARIGAAGLSYGGTCTLFLAALDERVRAAVVSGYLSSWRAAHTIPWNMCGSQILPGQLGAIEHLDIAALVAPRPLLAENGHRRPDLPGRRRARDRRRASGACTHASARPTTRSCTSVRRGPVARHRGAGVLGEVVVSAIDERLRPSWVSTLPGPYPPHDPLDAVVVHGGRARTSGQLPRDHDGTSCNPGVLGADLTVEEGAEAARWCALNALSVLRAGLGSLDRIDRVLTVLGFVASRARLRAAARGRRRREPAARPTCSAPPAGTAAPRSASPRCRAAARSRSRSRSR